MQLGDVTKWREWDLPEIDLLIGGSPCQGFSFAGKQLNFDDPRSKLFFEFVDILNHYRKMNPGIKFMLENVRMKKEYQDVISRMLGVEPVCINSSLVSAQNRVRYYWTNIPNIKQPKDKKVFLANILLNLPDCNLGAQVRKKAKCVRVGGRNSPFGSKQEWDSPFKRVSRAAKVKRDVNKSACLTGGAHSGGNHSDMDIIHTPHATRRYSVTECCRLQTLPDDYFDKSEISNTQKYKAIGNGWTVDVISHILSYMNKESKD